MELMEFTDGSSVTNFVGRKSAFKDKQDFLEQCKREFDWIIDDLDLELKVEHVEDGIYCRYYPKMPEDMSHLDLESGYTFCEKGRGAFEVYAIDVKAVREVNPQWNK